MSGIRKIPDDALYPPLPLELLLPLIMPPQPPEPGPSAQRRHPVARPLYRYESEREGLS